MATSRSAPSATCRVGDLRGRLFVPTGATARGPLLVFFHGGGWVYGDLDSHDPACRFLAERSGVRVLSVDYRLAPEHPFPAAYEDAVAAYRWVVEHAASLGADPARLGGRRRLGRRHPGGHHRDRRAREGLPLAFQLLIYPGTDMTTKTESRRLFERGFYLTDEFMDLAKAHYLPDASRWADPEASPLLCEVPAGLAPAYVATAGFDPLRDEGEAYARKLAEAGVAGRAAAVPRPDPRVPQRGRRRPHRPGRDGRDGGPARRRGSGVGQ